MDGFDAIPMFSKKKIRILESIRTIQMGSTKNIVLVMRVIGSTDLQLGQDFPRCQRRCDDVLSITVYSLPVLVLVQY